MLSGSPTQLSIEACVCGGWTGISKGVQAFLGTAYKSLRGRGTASGRGSVRKA